MAFLDAVTVFLLYFLQGGIQGLAFDVLPMFLQKHPEAQDFHLSQLALAEYPFTVKFLLAPLVDGFYSRAIGRRETWLIPTQFVTAVGLIVLASNCEDLLARSPIAAVQLTCWLSVLTSMAALGDIATDAWASSLMSDSSASVSQALGLTFGIHCSSSVFYALSGRGMVGLTGLLTTFSVAGFAIVALFLLRLVFRTSKEAPATDSGKDEEEDGDGEPLGFSGVLRAVFTFLLLPNVRLYVGMQMFWAVHYGTATLMRVRFQQLGLTPELLADSDLYFVPLDFLTMVVAGRLASSANPLRTMYRFRWVEVCLMLGAYALYQFFLSKQGIKPDSDGKEIVVDFWQKWSYIGLTQVMGKVGTMVFVIKCSIHNSLGSKSPETSGTVITFLACCTNFAQAFPRTLAPLISNRIGFDAAFGVFSVAAAVALLASAHPVRRVGNPDDKGWAPLKQD